MSFADTTRPRWSAFALLAAACLVAPSLACAQQTDAPVYRGTGKPADNSSADKTEPSKTEPASTQDTKTNASTQEVGGTSTKAEIKSPEDRAQADREAFFDARIAALHAGLTLTSDEEPLWAPVESAIRAFAKTGGRRRSREEVSSLLREAPSDLVRMRSEQLIGRGEAMKKLVDATGPLMEKLSDTQKNRLPVLLQGLRPSRILRAAFDIRYGEVVNDPDDDSGSKSNQTSDRNGDQDQKMGDRHNRMRDDSGYGGQGSNMPRHHRDQDGDDDRS